MARTRTGRILFGFVVAATLAAGLAGCSSDDSDGGDGEAKPPDISGPAYEGSVRVSAIDNIYRPEELKVVTGTEVVWSNDGQNDHNVLPNNDDEDWGAETADFKPGDEYSHTFDTAGTYRYYCSLHATKTAGSMRGVVLVLDEGDAPDVTKVG